MADSEGDAGSSSGRSSGDSLSWGSSADMPASDDEVADGEGDAWSSSGSSGGDLLSWGSSADMPASDDEVASATPAELGNDYRAAFLNSSDDVDPNSYPEAVKRIVDQAMQEKLSPDVLATITDAQKMQMEAEAIRLVTPIAKNLFLKIDDTSCPKGTREGPMRLLADISIEGSLKNLQRNINTVDAPKTSSETSDDDEDQDQSKTTPEKSSEKDSETCDDKVPSAPAPAPSAPAPAADQDQSKTTLDNDGSEKDPKKRKLH